MPVVKHIFFIWWLLISGAYVTHAQESETLSSLKQIVSILASDSLEGRAAGSHGGEKAAHFLFHQLQQQNSTFLFPSGFQIFQVKGNLFPTEKNSLRFQGEEFSLYKDYLPFQRSINTAIKAPVCFVGFGVSSAQHNDYSNIDVCNKWVLLFRGSPSYVAEDLKLKNKIALAARRGAAGVLVTTPNTAEFQEDWIAMQLGQNLPFSLFFANYADLRVPILQISTRLADCILQHHQTDVRTLSHTLYHHDTVINFTVSDSLYAESDVQNEKLTLRNIAVVLPGTNKKLKEEYIVAGAHYDHLGTASGNQKEYGKGDIFHGADDNASGVAAVFELFRRLKLKNKNKRSILFLFFDGEENGLQGSDYFINHLPENISLSNIKAMVNLDMVGRYENELQVLMTRSSEDGYKRIQKLIPHSHCNLSTPEKGNFIANSDHYPFYKQGIPVFFFFTKTHADYHKPGDSADKINYPALESIVYLVERFVLDLCNDKKAPRFQKLPDL